MALPSRLALRRLLTSAAPIIIVGMHRSGTSLLAQLLEGCGVFLGRRQSRGKRESVFFRDINSRILDLMGQSWRCVAHLPTVEELQAQGDWLTAEMRRGLERGFATDYLGIEGTAALLRGGLHWGWKDPRTSLLLPLWYRLFPRAQVIQIVRDGRDAALSLMVRDCRRSGADPAAPSPAQIARFVADVELWAFYLARIEQAGPCGSGILTLRYEDLLAEPERELATLLGRLGLDQARAGPAARIIDASRAYRARHADAPWLQGLDLPYARLAEFGYE
jgi:hypothetical protein